VPIQNVRVPHLGYCLLKWENFLTVLHTAVGFLLVFEAHFESKQLLRKELLQWLNILSVHVVLAEALKLFG